MTPDEGFFISSAEDSGEEALECDIHDGDLTHEDFVDHLTLDEEGEYESWEFHSDQGEGLWERNDEGRFRRF